MSNEFEIKVENMFDRFVSENKLKIKCCRYDEASFGNGFVDYETPDGIEIRIVRERLLWAIEFKCKQWSDQWFDMFNFMGYEDRRNENEREKVYSGKFNDEKQLGIVYKYLESYFDKIIKILKDENEFNKFHHYFNN